MLHPSIEVVNAEHAEASNGRHAGEHSIEKTHREAEHPARHHPPRSGSRAARQDRSIRIGCAGEMGPDSDVDLLVIKGGKFDRWRITTAIYRHLSGADAPVDVVVVTPEEVERYRDTHCLVICPALKEGKVVYGA